MPLWDIFERQSKEYGDSVLPPGVQARLDIEQASTFGWERYVGHAGRVIGMGTVRCVRSAQRTSEEVRVRA
jgi:transketolase